MWQEEDKILCRGIQFCYCNSSRESRFVSPTGLSEQKETKSPRLISLAFSFIAVSGKKKNLKKTFSAVTHTVIWGKKIQNLSHKINSLFFWRLFLQSLFSSHCSLSGCHRVCLSEDIRAFSGRLLLPEGTKRWQVKLNTVSWQTQSQASTSPCYETDSHDYNDQENTNAHTDRQQSAFWRIRWGDSCSRQKEGRHY